MKPRHTFGLLLLLLLLCALYYGMQYYQVQKEESDRVAREVFSFAPEEVQQLVINRIDEDPCKGERNEDGIWRILEPNPTIVPFQMMWERVTERLAHTLNEHTVLSAPKDLAQYGLDTPILTISGRTNDGFTFILNFGEVEPTQRSRYAQLNGGDLFLINTDTFFELNRPLIDLRYKFLVDDREAAPLEMEFAWIWTGAKEKKEGQPEIGTESIVIKVKRDAPEAPWRLTAPEEAPANYAAVKALADEVQFAVGKEFIDNPEALSDYGLDPPQARISLKDNRSGRKQTLWIGGHDESPEKKGLFVKRDIEDAVIVIDPHLMALLPKDPLAWRDKRLLTRRVSDINLLEYSTEFDRFVLKKDDKGHWSLVEPLMDVVNEQGVSGFLSFFKDLEGEEFVEAVKADAFASPKARIKLHFDDGSDAEILLAAAPDNPENTIALQDSGGVVTLSSSAAKMLLTDSENFRSREILRFNKTKVTGLQFTVDNVAYHIVQRHNRWILQMPENMKLHNQADVGTLLDAVNPLFMNRCFLAETPEGLDLYGLDAPTLDLTITLTAEPPQAPPTLTLRIGKPNPANPDERFALSSERPGIYLISQEVINQIREALKGIN